MAQLNQTLTVKEIDIMRLKVLDLLKFVDTHKARMRSGDRMKISNHLNYALGTMDNMINIRHVEDADPYNQPQSKYEMDLQRRDQTVVYNPDGTTTLVSKSNLSTGEGWEAQFDEGVLVRPPC